MQLIEDIFSLRFVLICMDPILWLCVPPLHSPWSHVFGHTMRRWNTTQVLCTTGQILATGSVTIGFLLYITSNSDENLGLTFRHVQIQYLQNETSGGI
ncbi:hypothetical protein F5879DRAFT_950384 [Lentinula edodes]|nr:hypothetical protein F5879DRAFT_950384 [Lentinula edodes]